jgi:chitin synthase
MQTSFNRPVCFLSVCIFINPEHFLSATGNAPHSAPLRRGRSLLGREEDVHESGLALFRRGTARRRRQSTGDVDEAPERRRRCLGNIPGPHDGWVTYCYLLTICAPPFLLRSCGECAIFHP